MPRLASVSDFRRHAARRLLRFLFDYIDGGAGGEETFRANRSDFAQVTPRPAALRDVSSVTSATTLLGTPCEMPLMLGPVGSLGLFRRNGEQATFNAARSAGISACLSSFSMTPPEALDLPAIPGAAFQLYGIRDRARAEALLERVSAAGARVLMVTVDTAVSGRRERDIRNGLREIERPDARLIADVLGHPRWLFDMMRAYPLHMFLAEGWPEAGNGYLAQARFLAGQIDPSLDWTWLRQLRSVWAGPLVLKGIMAAEDARRAVDCGVDGVVVSNHGGRQLDGAPSTIEALPAIAGAVGNSCDILLDGGIRRGSDVVKALASGASGCLLGRAYIFALAAAGEAGVRALLAQQQEEISTTLALMGVSSIAELRDAGPDALLAGRWWSPP